MCGLQRCIVVSKSRTMLPNVFLQRNHLISDTKQAKIQNVTVEKQERDRLTQAGMAGFGLSAPGIPIGCLPSKY